MAPSYGIPHSNSRLPILQLFQNKALRVMVQMPNMLIERELQ